MNSLSIGCKRCDVLLEKLKYSFSHAKLYEREVLVSAKIILIDKPGALMVQERLDMGNVP